MSHRQKKRGEKGGQRGFRHSKLRLVEVGGGRGGTVREKKDKNRKKGWGKEEKEKGGTKGKKKLIDFGGMEKREKRKTVGGWTQKKWRKNRGNFHREKYRKRSVKERGLVRDWKGGGKRGDEGEERNQRTQELRGRKKKNQGETLSGYENKTAGKGKSMGENVWKFKEESKKK